MRRGQDISLLWIGRPITLNHTLEAVVGVPKDLKERLARRVYFNAGVSETFHRLNDIAFHLHRVWLWTTANILKHRLRPLFAHHHQPC